jgi:hypothetical protein
MKPRAGGDKRGVNLTLDVKQRDAVAGGSSEMNPPSREVLHSILDDLKETYTDITAFPVNVTAMVDSEAVLMREDNPHKTEHVTRIVQEVTVVLDIMEDQHQAIQELLKEYADYFALAIKEVNAIPSAIHKLSIPEGPTFHTKIPPRSYNPDQ